MNATGIVTARRLNVRPDAAVERAPLGMLERGARVRVVALHGAWLEILFDGGTAFVHGDFVALADAHPAAGFLHERAELRDVPVEAPRELRLAAPQRGSAVDRTLARTWNECGGLLDALCRELELEPAAAVAVLQVESGGRAFGSDGRMIIRFENHVFWRRWGSSAPERFRAHFAFDDRRPWQGHRFRSSGAGPWRACHGSQESEWEVFGFARAFDETAALASISMGAPQIMGFNCTAVGYATPQAMEARFQEDLRFQLLALFDFVKGPGGASPMLNALRRGRWEEFAARYNGPGQAAVYGARIAERVERFRRLAGPGAPTDQRFSA